MAKNRSQRMVLGRGMGRGRCAGRGRGRRMAEGRVNTYAPITTLEQTTFDQIKTERTTREQEIEKLKEHAQTIAAQLTAIKSKIQELNENREAIQHVAVVNEERCIGCLLCSTECPFDAIYKLEDIATINREQCTGCGRCVSVCPQGAISLA